MAKGAANPGFLYCRALLHRFQSKSQEALKDLNAARASTELMADATYLMVDTYVAPIFDALWAGEMMDPTQSDLAITACRQLLDALPANERLTNKCALAFTQCNIAFFVTKYINHPKYYWDVFV